MRDKHQNVFYSYNLNSELIENNMTRAFIVTLKTVSKATKKYILSGLLKSIPDLDSIIDFDYIEFALQDRIPMIRKRIRAIPNKFLIALTANDIISDFEKYEDSALFEAVRTSSGIKPDAWFYDISAYPRYCFLIECKPANSVLSAVQLIAYDKYFFGAANNIEARERLIRITWPDIIELCNRLINDRLFANEQEATIIENLAEYLRYCGIIPFEGVHLEAIPSLPIFSFALPTSFCFDKLPCLPDYNFIEPFLFRLDDIPDMPNYRFLFKEREA